MLPAIFSLLSVMDGGWMRRVCSTSNYANLDARDPLLTLGTLSRHFI
jgi:hypothetical protein